MSDVLIARFEYGAQTFYVESDVLSIRDDFVPPTTAGRRVLGQGQYQARVEDEIFEPRAFEFTVNVRQASSQAARRVLENLQSFLNRAGDPKKPLYFAYREWGGTFPFEPSWGQFGAFERLRVLQGVVEFGDLDRTVYTGNLVACPVQLTIDPFFYGLEQELAQAEGGLFEEWAGRGPGSIGARVGKDTGTNENWFTNPIFGHATWNTGWTAGTNIIAEQNTDEAGRLFGFNSAYLTAKAATLNTFTQSINVGATTAHIISCYARRLDGGVIDSSSLSLYYGTTKTTRYLALKNGWYFLYAPVTGIASATASGVIVSNGVMVYVDGFQLETNTWPNPLKYGDLPGFNWSGTAHNSTTVGFGAGASGGKLRAPARRKSAEGTIQVVIQCMANSADLANDNYYVFRDGQSAYTLYYERGANNRWVFTDGTSSIFGPTTTFSLGDLFVLTLVWGEGAGVGVTRLYANNVSQGSFTTAPTATHTSTIYLGSLTTLTNQGPWVFLGFDVFDQPMAAADVSDFYAQASGLLADGAQRVSPIPYLWTKDGDDVVDNCDDTSRDNWLLAGGIGGSAPAETQWKITPSASKQGYWLFSKQFDYSRFVNPDRIWYMDLSGSADANASGASMLPRTVPNGVPGLGGVESGGVTPADSGLMAGRLQFFVRLKKATGSGDIYIWSRLEFPSTGAVSTSEARRITISTTYLWLYVGTLYYEFPSQLEDRNKQILAYVMMSTPSAAFDVHVDFIMVVDDALRMVNDDLAALTNIHVRGREIYVDNSSGIYTKSLIAIGDEVNLIPDQYNLAWFVLGDDQEAHVITQTGTFEITVRPRWLLQ